MTDTTKTAIGYIRVSTIDQADSGASLDAQRTKIRQYCELHDLQLVKIVEDAGASAKTLDRPGMTRVLDAVRRREIDVVIAAKLDRLTRSVRDLADLVELVRRTGVELAAVSDRIDTGTAAGRMLVNMLGVIGQWEREAVAERTSEALAAMRAAGRRTSGHAPFGWSHDDQGQLVEDEREQQAIAVMVDLRARGWSLRRIAAELERRGVTSRTGTQLTAKTIASALRAAA